MPVGLVPDASKRAVPRGTVPFKFKIERDLIPHVLNVHVTDTLLATYQSHFLQA